MTYHTESVKICTTKRLFYLCRELLLAETVGWSQDPILSGWDYTETVKKSTMLSFIVTIPCQSLKCCSKTLDILCWRLVPLYPPLTAFQSSESLKDCILMKGKKLQAFGQALHC